MIEPDNRTRDLKPYVPYAQRAYHVKQNVGITVEAALPILILLFLGALAVRLLMYLYS